MTKQILTQSRLKELLHYDPDTGLFATIKTRKGSGRIGSHVGALGVRGYLQCRINYKNHTMHRLAFLYMTGSFPENQVDHQNQIKTDNRWFNLRDVSGTHNQRNKPLSKNNTSGYVGITRVKKTGRWEAKLVAEGKRHVIGYFDNRQDAVKAWKMVAKKNGYHKNHGSLK